MGRLVQGPGNIFRWIIDDFSSGIISPGFGAAEGAGANEGLPERAFISIFNARSRSGMLEPISGDATYSVGIGVTWTCDLLFPYQTTVTQLLTINAGVLRHIFSGGTTSTATSVTDIGNLGKRVACQFLGYTWISGGISATSSNQTPQQLFRYHMDAPGSGRTSAPAFVTVTQLGKAGTPAPTTVPTMAISTTAGGLTTATQYKYRLAWKYGIGGELGMGWKQSATSITVTGPTQSVSITVDQHPPNEYCHVIKRSLYRNTDAFPDNFFLVTETAYTNTLPSSILDSASDASIELGEQTDPMVQAEGTNTASDPYKAEMLPPKAVYCCAHESRVWLGDLTDSTNTRYPTSVVYSEISGISPRPDQYRPKNKITLPAGHGRMTGLISWMGNLYVTFERAIFVQSQDPGPGRLPAFNLVVAGYGCSAPLSMAAGPDGIYMQSGNLPIKFTGGPQPDPIGDRISSRFRGSAAASYSVGGYDPDIKGYCITVPPGGGAFEYDTFGDSGRGSWMQFNSPTAGWAYCCSLNGYLAYSSATITQLLGYVFLRGAGSLGVAITQTDSPAPTALYRSCRTMSNDMGYPAVKKHVKRVRIIYATSVTATDYMSLTADGEAADSSWATTFTGSGKVFGFATTPIVFRSLAAYGRIAWGSTFTRTTPIRAMEVEFTMDTERLAEDVSQ